MVVTLRMGRPGACICRGGHRLPPASLCRKIGEVEHVRPPSAVGTPSTLGCLEDFIRVDYAFEASPEAKVGRFDHRLWLVASPGGQASYPAPSCCVTWHAAHARTPQRSGLDR